MNTSKISLSYKGCIQKIKMLNGEQSMGAYFPTQKVQKLLMNYYRAQTQIVNIKYMIGLCYV